MRENTNMKYHLSKKINIFIKYISLTGMITLAFLFIKNSHDINTFISAAPVFADAQNEAKISLKTEEETALSIENGDINSDGSIDIRDSALYRRYIAGWEIEINQAVADVNSDHTIDIKDSALIKRYLAGWGVNLQEQLEYTIEHLETDHYSSEGNLVYEHKMLYPVFNGNSTSAGILNDYYEEIIENFNMSDEEAGLIYHEANTQNFSLPVHEQLTAEIQYNQNSVISISNRYSDDFGGEETPMLIDCLNYSITTGELLELDDIVKGSEEEKDHLYQMYLNKYIENVSVEQLKNSRFCLKSSGLCIYYYHQAAQQYVEITIPYTATDHYVILAEQLLR